MINMLLAIASLIILILAAVALHMHWRLHKQRQEKALAEVEASAKRAEQRQRVNSSIQIIAQALEVNQVGATEASIRISVLLDALNVDGSIKDEFAPFYALAQEASHIPVLDAWKALPKQQRRTYEVELVAMEEKHHGSVVDAAKRIQGREF